MVKIEFLSFSIWKIGNYDRSQFSIKIGEYTLPDNAKLMTQNVNGLINPLGYVTIADTTPQKSDGMLLMTTLSVLSGSVNYIEGIH